MEIGELFFGNKEAGRFVSICASLMFFIGANQTTTPVLNSLGLENKTLRNYIIGLALFIPLILILPKFVGVYSIAIANGAMLLVSCLLNFLTLKRRGIKLNYKLRNLFMAALTAPCILLSNFLRGILKNYLTDFFVILFCSIVAIGLYTLVITVFKVMPINFSFKIRRKDKKTKLTKRKARKQTLAV